jgi:hypothetical protein
MSQNLKYCVKFGIAAYKRRWISYNVRRVRYLLFVEGWISEMTNGGAGISHCHDNSS